MLRFRKLAVFCLLAMVVFSMGANVTCFIRPGDEGDDCEFLCFD
jgi:hypothetical protein